MAPSLRALLAGIIDYAGLFPPANLALERAIRNYARHQKTSDKWMLGRFIIPAARLAELAPFEKLFEDDPPFVFSVLGRGGKTADEFLQGLTDDLGDITRFCQRHAGRVEVDVFEVKLPEALVRPGQHLTSCYTLVRAGELMENQGPPALTPFYEIGLEGDWRAAVQAAVAMLQYLVSYAPVRVRGGYQHCRPAGFKLRCGGPTASAVPSPQQVAGVLVACRDADIYLKATAGLHHPFRHRDENLKTHVHGFLNIFVAAALAATHGLDESQVLAIIEDEKPEHFVFDDEVLRWRDLTANVDDIAAARQRLAMGFGSCSFDEPREDLRALGLL
jgi:hypothetical protein